MVLNPAGPEAKAKAKVKPVAVKAKVKRASLVDAVHEAFITTGPEAHRNLLMQLSERIEALEQQ